MMELAEDRKYPRPASSSRSASSEKMRFTPVCASSKLPRTAHADVFALLRDHLQLLHFGNAAVGIEHKDFRAVHIAEALKRGLARVAGGRDEDADGLLLARFPGEAVSRYGSICSAISLNAHVGPCHSS